MKVKVLLLVLFVALLLCTTPVEGKKKKGKKKKGKKEEKGKEEEKTQTSDTGMEIGAAEETGHGK